MKHFYMLVFKTSEIIDVTFLFIKLSIEHLRNIAFCKHIREVPKLYA